MQDQIYKYDILLKSHLLQLKFLVLLVPCFQVSLLMLGMFLDDLSFLLVWITTLQVGERLSSSCSSNLDNHGRQYVGKIV